MEVPFPLASSPARAIETRPCVLDAPRVLSYWHLTSLDAPTVAIVWSLAFAWSAGIHLEPWIPVVQALGVWSIYITDRLLDAGRALRQERTALLRERHCFHWQHRQLFIPLALAAACGCAWMIFTFMPIAARERNSLLAAAAVVYLARVHSASPKELPSAAFLAPLLSKELLVGFLFTIGCILPAMVRSVALGNALWPILLAGLCFALLAWLNCYSIDHWESQERDRSPYAILVLGNLLGGCLLLASLASYSHPRCAALLVAGAASALLLALLDPFHSRLTPLTLRAAADLVLLTPLALLLR